MSEHYFTESPTTEHQRRTFSVEIRGQTFRFCTDRGVFSREQVDFGSRLLVHTMEIGRDDHILDVGCGYGVIGIVAASLATSGQVLMVDVNERALELAKLNAETNGIRNIQLLKSDLLASVENQMFHKIITNPPIRAGKLVVHQIFEQAYSRLYSGGELWVVIQKKQGAPSAIKKLEEIYPVVRIVSKDKGYNVIVAQK